MAKHWGSRPILDLGVRWRIGDGKSIKMWHDAWVSNTGTGKLITPVRIMDQNTSVDALIDNVNHSWRLDTSSEVLLPIDVERILQIPISTTGISDSRL